MVYGLGIKVEFFVRRVFAFRFLYLDFGCRV